MTFDTPAAPLPAGGGSGAIPVKAERECSWTAEVSDPWLNITAGRSGQGNGTVEFTAAANGDPVARTGGIMLNGTRAQVVQAASECRYTLGANSGSFGQDGGAGGVEVGASSALCTWTATSNHDWITVTSGATGKGSARVSFTVAPTTGPPRSGTLTIAGLRFEVTQAEGCTYAIAPSAFNAGAAGGTSTVTVTAPAGCPWSASSGVSWISLATPSGVGSGTVALTVSATSGPTRSATVTIAGQPFTVTQSPGCAYDVAPLSHTVDANGGSRTVTVTAAAGCAWTASSSVPWITITAGNSGTGPGSVAFVVAATTGPSRTGTIVVGGQTVTILQSQGCAFAISPETQSVPASGGEGTVAVSAGAGCAWTATSGVPWITIASGANGSGSGSVSYSVAPSSGPPRSGTLSIAGRTFTVNQGVGCSFAISPANHTAASGGGNVTVAVTAAAGCAWTAESQAPWIGIASGGSGSGAGSVTLAIAANGGADRQGTVTIAGQTFTVQQAGGCTYTLSPRDQNVPAGGASGSFSVSAAGGCAWTAVANAPWLSITSGANGTGPGTVQFTAAANTGAARSATITAGGETFTVTQASGCSAVVAPESFNVTAAGGAQNVTVTTAAECSWTAASNVPWVAITAGAAGSGSATVQLTVQPNTGPARGGTATIAGRTVAITQENGCTYSLAPAMQNVGVPGGSRSVAVTAGAGCAWTAVSNVGWITIIRGGTGSGADTVEYRVDANATGAPRSGTITIAGQTFTVTQSG